MGIFPNKPHPHFNKGIPFNDNHFGTFVHADCLFVTSPLKNYVESWILKGRHSAVDINSKERAMDVEYDKNMVKVWSFLNFFFVLNFFLFCFMRKYIVF
jgi:hypothetical protein